MKSRGNHVFPKLFKNILRFAADEAEPAKQLYLSLHFTSLLSLSISEEQKQQHTIRTAQQIHSPGRDTYTVDEDFYTRLRMIQGVVSQVSEHVTQLMKANTRDFNRACHW